MRKKTAVDCMTWTGHVRLMNQLPARAIPAKNVVYRKFGINSGPTWT